MSNKIKTRKIDFTPEDAFLIALDDAVAATALSLHESGLDEETIWAAFRTAVSALHDAANDIEEECMAGSRMHRYHEQVA